MKWGKSKNVNSSSEFITEWNASSSKGIIVVNCHGAPTTMLDLGIEDVNALDNLSCDCLILLGCNLGHYDFEWSNIAFAFSRKINGGVVVASDGTVYSLLDLGYQRFRSKNDKTYKGYCTDTTRANKGWVLYRKSGTTIYWHYTGLYTISIPSVIDYLIGQDMFAIN